MIVLRAIVIAVLFVKAIGPLAIAIVRRAFSRNGRGFYDLLGKALADLMEDLGPTFIKVGQLLGTRRDLFPPALIAHLAALQDDLTPTSFKYLRKRFRADFGVDVEAAFADIDTRPIASASIASVFKARLRDGRLVAVKVRKPGVANKVRDDVRLLKLLVRIIERLPFVATVPLREIFEELTAALIGQVDLECEAESNRRLNRALREEKLVTLPRLVESLCSKSVLTMEYFDEIHTGVKLANAAKAKALANGLCALYRMIFIEGFVHCDMHPANFHLLDEGRVILLDFGMTAKLETKVRTGFAEFFYAMVVNDGFTCSEITLETATAIPTDLDRDSFSEEIVDLVDRYSGRKVTGFQVAGFVVGMFDIQRKYKIRGTSTFMMAIISLLVFEGVAKQVDPELDFQSFSIPYIQEALKMRRRVDHARGRESATTFPSGSATYAASSPHGRGARD